MMSQACTDQLLAICVNVRVFAPPELIQELWRPAVRPRGERRIQRTEKQANADDQQTTTNNAAACIAVASPLAWPQGITVSRLGSAQQWAGLASSQLVQGKCRNLTCACNNA